MTLFRPIPILRMEAAVVLAASLAAYGELAGNWRIFGVFFFAPDISILPYVVSARAGSAAYNVVHSYLWPVLLGLIAYERTSVPLWTAALIWCAHISWDRLCGFGLKQDKDFWVTHLGAIRTGEALWKKLTAR